MLRAQMMQIMEADVTSPATQYGLNTLILPEVHAWLVDVPELDVNIVLVWLRSPMNGRHVHGCVSELPGTAKSLPVTFKRSVIVLGLQDKRVAAIAEAGQKRCTEWLGILETKLSDGRAYIAGDEFTAAGNDV